jgi:hypothetical protein
LTISFGVCETPIQAPAICPAIDAIVSVSPPASFPGSSSENPSRFGKHFLATKMRKNHKKIHEYQFLRILCLFVARFF